MGENQLGTGPVLEDVPGSQCHRQAIAAPNTWAPCARTKALVYDARPGHGNARFRPKPGFFTGVWTAVSDPRLGPNGALSVGYTNAEGRRDSDNISLP